VLASAAVDTPKLHELLEALRAGTTTVDAVARELRDLPFSDLGFAKVDHHRAVRQGVAEVLLGSGKTPEQIAGISKALLDKGQNVLVTRVAPDAARDVRAILPALHYREVSRLLVATPHPIAAIAGRAVVVSAGTSDFPVVEECSETLRVLGVTHERIHDVGVAGIHRLLSQREAIAGADLAIVVAGMEGALPSVVGGLVDIPVIAVPTSVGYGAAFQGVAALLGMLTSCASGITVVNIDNGFGAAFAAVRMLRMKGK
jgi:pyridinium-3,5-biscarboxylic acid mononucleotide synthase